MSKPSRDLRADGGPVRVGLNGFGRIGRGVFRAALDDPRVEVAGINDVMDDEQMRYLIAHDSVYGRLEDVALEDGRLVVGDASAPLFDERDPADLPWADLDVDVALECTGLFRTYEDASGHLDAGADRALISAPPRGDREVPQIVYGVNHDDYDGEAVVSNASCTTNSVAPVAKVLDETFGIASGMLTTVHSYTGSQNLIDGPASKTRRGRAAAENIVPTTTGAAQATTQVLPQLEGRLDGMAMRVPVPDGSITEFVADLEGDPSARAINDALRAAADGELAGVLAYTDEEVVSQDVVGLPASSTVDLRSTNVVAGGAQAKVLAWYDNEFGFANRMLDVAAHIAP
ncbi:MAG: type I glyceraldehyde-3-phosphate dehydrogenase [Halobacteriales archaeon]